MPWAAVSPTNTVRVIQELVTMVAMNSSIKSKTSAEIERFRSMGSIQRNGELTCKPTVAAQLILPCTLVSLNPEKV